MPVRSASGELVPFRGDSWHRINGIWFQKAGWINHGDNQGRIAVRRRADPGCGYWFGGGNDSYGDLRTPIETGGDNPNKTVSDNDHVSGLGYTDHNKPNSFLNGFMTAGTGGGADVRGYRGISYWEGSEGDAVGNRDVLLQILAAWPYIREPRDQHQGMVYFETSLHDTMKVKGEIVVSTMDYETRDISGNLDEWDRRSRYGRNVASLSVPILATRSVRSRIVRAPWAGTINPALRSSAAPIDKIRLPV